MILNFCWIIALIGLSGAQLDLPPITEPPTSSVRPNGYIPSQSFRNHRDEGPGDEDRSSRSGPPYSSIEEDEPLNREGRVLSGGTNYNGSANSPFNDRNSYYDRNNPYNTDERNRYFVSERERERNYDRFNDRNRNPYDNDDRNRNPYNNDDRNRNPYSYDDRNRNPYNNDDRNRNPYNNDDRNRNPYNNDDRNRNPYNYDDRNRVPYNPNRNPYDDRNRDGGVFVNERDRERNFNRDRFPDNRPRFEDDYRYQQEMEKLRNFLSEIDHKGSEECTENVAAQWEFETNVNDHSSTAALAAQQHYAEFLHITHDQSAQIDRNLIFDENLLRQLNIISQVGPNALTIEQQDRYNRLINEMLALYGGAAICAYQSPFHCGLKLNPELRELMARSRDWDELQHIWLEYRRKSGREMRDNYAQLIDVMNEIAYANNITNGGEYWYSAFESYNFREDLERVWEEIKPLYEGLHAYVRRKLREYYGPDKINRNAPIPAHILGDMYGQSWSHILDIILPYPGRNFIDITPKMVEELYTPPTLFQVAQDFFASLNFTPVLPPEFWQHSIIEEVPGRNVLCQPSAWDFCNRHDFRIKMCTKVNHRDFITVHHELSNIHYFLSYRHHPKVFRDGANPAFHQAIGDAIGLSVSTPHYLQSLNLLQKNVDDSPHDINYLFAMAADKVVFLPYALALDNWRYDLFSGRATKNMMNCHYWDLREQYGGIKPPFLRSELDFDPGSKYHVPANIPYMKYFVSTVLQFQIYRAMCLASNQYIRGDPRKPLHKCDIFRQPEAGKILRNIMEKGSSQPWQQTLNEAIGSSRLDGSALREYFAPLEEWLRQENLRNNEIVGWYYDGDYCKRSIETANLQISGGYYNHGVSTIQFDFVIAAITILSGFLL